jgi:hypothetical protein
MTDQPSGRQPSSRASEIAAQQVESIVSAAQAAADQLRGEAERQAAELRAAGERDAARQLDKARAEALRLGQDARREAEKLLADAEHDAQQTREQTRRQVQGRVAAAEEAASQVMEEAQVLSSGLQRLGQMLGNQGERILRDVQAAHRRMQSDLHVEPEPAPPRSAPARRFSPSRTPAGEEDEALETLRRAVAGERRGTERRGGSSQRAGTRERPNPIDDLEVPNWVEPP